MYSALNSRLLFPPSTRTDPGTRGPIDRMSKPRTLYSPPRNNVSKIGRTRRCDRRYGADVLDLCAEAERDTRRWRKNEDASPRGLMKLRVAAEHRKVDRRR